MKPDNDWRKAIYQYVFALSHGADKGVFYYGDWIRRPGVAICSCNDGLRPVIFKIEATGEESNEYVTAFSQRFHASMTVSEDSKHFFHTER